MRNKGVNFYTDIALEVAETLYKDNKPSEIEGVNITKSNGLNGEASITWVEIYNESGADALGKPIGNYVTVESAVMKQNDIDAHEEIIKILVELLADLYKLDDGAQVLIIGLGNQYVTPDALGPGVVSKILVTRHITEDLPRQIDNSVRPVCAIAPGVMGVTGIETAEIVRGLCDRVKPELVIAIDALAARKADRINSTIQMSDTGVSPGAGMGNKRTPLNHETLGVPVIAIGVPTVVDAATLVNDTMDIMITHMLDEISVQEAFGEPSGGGVFYEMLDKLGSDEKYGLIRQVLDPYIGNMFVTPKEVDEVVKRLSNIIANAINISLHKGISKDDINRFMY